SAIATAAASELATRQRVRVASPGWEKTLGVGLVQPNVFPSAWPLSSWRTCAMLFVSERAREIVRPRGSTASSAIVATGGGDVWRVCPYALIVRAAPRVGTIR